MQTVPGSIQRAAEREDRSRSDAECRNTLASWLLEEGYPSHPDSWCCPMEDAFQAGRKLGQEEGLRQAARMLEIGRQLAPAMAQWRAQPDASTAPAKGRDLPIRWENLV